MSFRFTKETPDESMFNDMQTLNTLSAKQADVFVGILIRFLAQQETDLMQAVGSFAEENGLSTAELKGVLRGGLYFLRESARANSSPTHLREDLLRFGVHARPVRSLLRSVCVC
jgi:hypothetical protein